MKPTDLIRMRLQRQLLLDHDHTTPAAIVAHMGAMQAQDFNGCRWAIGTRLPGITDADVLHAIECGDIIRTHLLRPTWHLATKEDVRWMLRLSAPQIRASMTSRHDELDLHPKSIAKCQKVITEALAEGPVSRPDLVAHLERNKIATGDNRTAHILMLLEIDEVICSGPLMGKQISYSLMDGRVPALKAFDKAESLRTLALRYFTSHGPATQQDFAWWSGLRIADVRAAIEAASPSLEQETSGDKTYYWAAGPAVKQRKTLHLLPPFDEYIVAYQDRSDVLPATHFKTAVSSNGIFYPVVLENGKAIGLWKKEQKKGRLQLTPALWSEDVSLPAPQWKKAIQELTDFHA
jgi:hypothetical protein